jgi:hypothetical protein
MNRTLLILLTGIVLAMAGYAGIYYTGTASHSGMVHGVAPELAWLKEEFRLSDTEFAHVCQVHDDYQAGCAERCAEIDQKNQQLARLLAASQTVTPEIEKLLLESAQLRAQCQKKMLQHFYEVSRTMPPDEGKRYLAWVQQQTILADTHSTMHH